MRDVFTIIIRPKTLVAALLVFGAPIAPVFAQGPGAALDEALARQEQATTVVDLKVNDAVADLIRKIEAEEEDRRSADIAQGLGLLSIEERLQAAETALASQDKRILALEEGATDPDPLGGGAPAPARSLMTLLNVAPPKYWTREDAFINHILVTGGTDRITAPDGTVTRRDRYDGWVADGIFDPQAARFVKMPASGSLTLGIVRDGVEQAPAHYAGVWVLDWEGDGDVTLRSGSIGSIEKISANRIEENFDPVVHGTKRPTAVITRIGAGGIGNIRFYRKAHEALIAAGKTFDPVWQPDACGFDVLRPMDWAGANQDRESTAADRPRVDAPVYFNDSVPDRVLVRAAVECGARLWINAPGMISAPAPLLAELRNRTLPQAERVALIADNFAAIMASDEPLKWARAFVAALDDEGYPKTRPLYVEFDNEVWNWTFFLSTEYAWGVGQGAKRLDPALRGSMRTGYGFLSARYAQAFAQALAEAGRGAQPWTMVLGAHTADAGRTRDALEAVASFNARTPGAQALARYGVATTNYYSIGFQWKRDNRLFGEELSESDWNARWFGELAADPAGLKARITARMLDPEPLKANVAWIFARVAEHKAIAEEFGAAYIGNYEGDSHDVMSDALRADPAAVALFYAWHEGPEHARVIDEVARRIEAIGPGLIMANYLWRAGGRGPGAAWIEGAPWDDSGEDNKAWRRLMKPAPAAVQ